MTVEILDVSNGSNLQCFEKDAGVSVYANAIPITRVMSPLSPPATRDASPTPSRQARLHTKSTYEAWQRVRSFLKGENVKLDGESLDVPSVVAVAK